MARDDSPHSTHHEDESERARIADDNQELDETAPLLTNERGGPSQQSRHDDDDGRSIDNVSVVSVQSGVTLPEVTGKPWASTTAIIGLTVAVICVLIGVFVGPSTVEEYGKQALTIEPKGLAIDSFTRTGVKARVQADAWLDPAKVNNSAIRTIGRFGMWMAHYLESEPTDIAVYLPEYNNMTLGTAQTPGMKLNVRAHEVTHLDFVALAKPGKIVGLQEVTDDFLKGRIAKLTVQGLADVKIKWKFVPLGETELAPKVILEGHDLPPIPPHNITHLSVHEVELSESRRRTAGSQKGVIAEATVDVQNPIPIGFQIPTLKFDVLVNGCTAEDEHIKLGEVSNEAITVEPKVDIEARVAALVRGLPDALLTPCTKTKLSPLDSLVGDYMAGKNATIFVRGAQDPSPDTPEWIAEFLSKIEVPVPVPGQQMGDLVKELDFQDIHFSMPDPWADPEDPKSNPRISGNLIVLAQIPDGIEIDINVQHVRATADVFHKKKKLGVMELKEWQKSSSQKIPATDGKPAMLMVKAKIDEAPLKITDQDVFSDMVQKLLFGDGTTLDIKALADMEAKTVLGKFALRNIPGEGSVPVKAPSSDPNDPSGGGSLHDKLSHINPRVYDLQIVSSTPSSLTLEAKMNFTNPTNYTATVPHFNILIVKNGSVIGDATVSNLEVREGNNTGSLARVTWNPLSSHADKHSPEIARNLLSQYISGYNCTMQFRTHADSVPGNPGIGKALERYPIEMPMPHLSAPLPDDDSDGDDDEDGKDRPSFIKEATFHLLSSTAVFLMHSPFAHTTMYLETINATAFYNGTEVIGTIDYRFPFKVVPGVSESPRLPVKRSEEGMGWDRIREALGGRLRLNAKAEAGVRIGEWREDVWVEAGGIGSKVRL